MISQVGFRAGTRAAFLRDSRHLYGTRDRENVAENRRCKWLKQVLFSNSIRR